MNTKHEVPLKALAAMGKYEQAREVLRAFENDNARLVEEYQALKGQLSAATEDVKEVYRENHEVIGPKWNDFSLRYGTEIDAQKVYEIMGEKAVELGIVVIEPKIIRKAFEAALKNSQIPARVIKEAETAKVPAVVTPSGTK